MALTSATLQTALTATDKGSIFAVLDHILDQSCESHIPGRLRQGIETRSSQLYRIHTQCHEGSGDDGVTYVGELVT